MIGLFPRLLLVCLLGLPWQAVAAAPVRFGGAVAGVLVLRNGNVLLGHVVRQKDHYQVEMAHGQLQVPADQVEMFCHNLDEAYAERRRVRTGSTADSHLELAHWCLRHRLYKHATRELQDARAIDPGHRKLAMLERQLLHAQQRAAPAKAAVPAAPLLPRNSTKTTQRVPQRARAMFVRQIQPMLVKSCAAAGCHQSGLPFQLNRLAVVGAGHPQATQGNLASTLAQVDRQAPDKSELLSFASTSHGSRGAGSSRPLKPRQIQMLRSWLEQLAATSRGFGFAEESAESLVRSRPLVRSRLTTVVQTASASSRPAQGVRTANVEIEDPFDPEVFNRQYRQDVKRVNDPLPDKGQTVPTPQ